MDKRSVHFFIGIIAFLIFSGSTPIAAQANNDRIYIQGLMGTMRLHEGDFTFEGEQGSDESVVFEGDSTDIPYLGFSWQQVLGGNRLQYGVEGGLLASWKTEKWQVAVSNGTAYVHIKNSMLLADLFLGGYTSMNIGKRIRLYIGGGPLLIYGQRKIDPEENDDLDTSDIVYENMYESGWNVGVYARTGVDFIVSDKFIFGLCARGMTSNLEFDNNDGDSTKVEGVQLLFTLSAALSESDYM